MPTDGICENEFNELVIKTSRNASSEHCLFGQILYIFIGNSQKSGYTDGTHGWNGLIHGCYDYIYANK